MYQNLVSNKKETVLAEELESSPANPEESAPASDEGECKLVEALASVSFSSRLQLR